jgi:phosphatidylethanolamine/phosphatidyl-N-methylethanolamine N-methyltransferase
MLERARRRVPAVCALVDLRQGDAAAREVATGSFDAAIFSLVLSVVPDPVAVVAEVMRTLRPGGRAMIFDKVAPERLATCGQGWVLRTG